MGKIVILGKELEGDFLDADFMAKYESATKEMHGEAMAKKGAHYDSVAQAFRDQCDVVRAYFDRIFGEGTSAALFGEQFNIRTHVEATAELTDRAAAARKEMNDLTNKYTQRAAGYKNSQKRR